MAVSDKLECTVYVEPDISIGESAQFAVDRLGGSFSGPVFGMTVTAPACEIEVRRNPDHQIVAQGVEDRFLFFRNKLEVYPDAGCQREGMIDGVRKIPTSLWAHGWAAVAACDYEADLPSRRGYGCTPWSNVQVDFGKPSTAPRATV